MALWLAKEGNGGSNWLVERCHALSILADGTRQSPDAELDYVCAQIVKVDKQRARQAADLARARADRTTFVSRSHQTVPPVNQTASHARHLLQSLGGAQ